MRNLVVSYHALTRMGSWKVADLQRAIETGEVLESYPDDKPFPSRLILSTSGSRALHVVAADDPESEDSVIVTVYEPHPSEWSEDYRTRRTKS